MAFAYLHEVKTYQQKTKLNVKWMAIQNNLGYDDEFQARGQSGSTKYRYNDVSLIFNGFKNKNIVMSSSPFSIIPFPLLLTLPLQEMFAKNFHRAWTALVDGLQFCSIGFCSAKLSYNDLRKKHNSNLWDKIHSLNLMAVQGQTCWFRNQSE